MHTDKRYLFDEPPGQCAAAVARGRNYWCGYRICRDVIGEIPGPQKEGNGCGCCGAGIPRGAPHCRTCGEVVQRTDEEVLG
ncbi:MAG: hypothetical protein JXI32_02200 [Deltaproteobacteria bacterium]|nr:hypothetical protein [Deltaproteobacteria bacterium]